MAETLTTTAPRAPSLPLKLLLACLAIMVIGAAIVGAVVFASFNGFDRGLSVFSYLTFPTQELIQPVFDAFLPDGLDGPEAGVALILFSAWVQASVIVGAVLAVGWILLAVFRATGRQTAD